MEDIKKLKDNLEKALNQSELDKVLEYLKKANDFEINKEVLKSTDIGKTVGKLRTHKDIGISKQSSILIDKWKKDIEKSTPISTPTSTKPASSAASPSSSFKRKSSDTVQTTTTVAKQEIEERPSKRVFEEKKISTTTFKCTITPIKTGGDAGQRNKMIQLLAESLTREIDETLSSPEDVATEVEAELYSIYKGLTADYKNKVRSFKFNLQSNDGLRDSLLNRILTIEKFCSMDVMSMASDELKEERRKLDKFQTEASMIGTNNEATTDQFQCGKCKQRRCTYFQMQTRSADEPMTTFVRCINCGNRWKFC
ncbi:hypothetical protein DICPUDRAFT_77009 [Dictyostelium purpureum]|uniref:Transcription elongation factor n=1 Tax=Dictyostelium purpureum TaxID=5786 RepID=F0ZFB7_DICPU|nr:uncharacterized protein DICPUDRAFT_77009 [Dictyostelium purpureum]EGC37355.1 hypothetical protein DICPUDRAFT_77009 [Dictyostelium purpureum]|eukprot:XP_003286096.1 hypothetical protein DICPUDRAFT_77009 [Dictyostelium purpureum]